jgi:hypothetical protein
MFTAAFINNRKDVETVSISGKMNKETVVLKKKCRSLYSHFLSWGAGNVSLPFPQLSLL